LHGERPNDQRASGGASCLQLREIDGLKGHEIKAQAFRPGRFDPFPVAACRVARIPRHFATGIGIVLATLQAANLPLIEDLGLKTRSWSFYISGASTVTALQAPGSRGLKGRHKTARGAAQRSPGFADRNWKKP